MAFAGFSGSAYLPPYWTVASQYQFGFSSLLLNGSSTPKTTVVGKVPKSGTLDKAEFNVSFVSSPSDVKVSFQDPDTSGDPDGTADQYRVISSGSIASGWIAPGLMTSDGTDSGSKRSVTAGDDLAVVIEWNATQTGQFWIDYMSDNGNAYPGSAYGANHNGSSWTHTTSGGYYSVVLKYSDGTYAGLGPHCAPITATNQRALTTATTPDEMGIYFSLPGPVQCRGAWVGGTGSSTSADFDVVLYDSDGSTVLASDSVDAAHHHGNVRMPFTQVFWAPVDLDADTNYRLVVKPTTTNTVHLYTGTFNAAAITEAWGGGTWHRTARTDAGSWTETTTERPHMGLCISGIDDAAGGGGSGGAFTFVG